MSDYKNGKIYKIVSKHSDLIYIGSTIQTLKNRLYKHTNDFHYCTSNELINLGDYKIILVERYSCDNDIELRIREQYYMDKFKSDGYRLVNKKKAYLSEEENKEYKKQWIEKNREEIRRKQTERDYINRHKRKQRRDNNRDEINIKKREYYKENREEQTRIKREYRKNNLKKCIEYERERSLFRRPIVVNLMSNFITDIANY